MKISRDINLSSDAFTTSKAQQISPAKTSAPKSDVPPVSQDDLTKINALVGEFLSDNSELASRDMHRLLCLLTKDQSFQTFLEENTKFRICEKAAEGDSQVTYPDVSRENILREMLKGGGGLTSPELNDFQALLRGELLENPETWSAKLSTFANTGYTALSPDEKKYIENILTVLDEYNCILEKQGTGNNYVHYKPFALDINWLQFRDITLLPSNAPCPEGKKEEDVLRVPPDAMKQVRDAQMAIGYLQQQVDNEYSGKLEKTMANGGANHIEVCIQTMGQALAESMVTLCKATAREETDPSSTLYQQQENAIVELLARDTMELIGEGGAVALLDDNKRSDFDKMRAEIFKLPDGQKAAKQQMLQKKLQEELTTHLTTVAKRDAGLSEGLGILTQKAMDKNSKTKLASLKESAISIQHAINKSVRLRQKIKDWGNVSAKNESATLLRTMKHCEKTLSNALTTLNKFKPGVTDNLKTAGCGLLEKAWDGNLGNYFGKKLLGVKNGLSSVGSKINNLRKEVDGSIFSKIGISPSLPENKKIELSTLLIPLENTADQLRSVARPLQVSAEKLERVLKHHNKDYDAIIHKPIKVNAQRKIQKNEGDAGVILETMLNVALEKTESLSRLENKKQEREDSVRMLKDNTLKVLSHTKEKMGEELEENITALSNTFSSSGAASEYIVLARQLAQSMTAQVESLERTLLEAERTDCKKMESIAKEIAEMAKNVIKQADSLSADIKLITGKVLGIGFKYGAYEKNMARYLVSEASKLSNEDKSDIELMVDHLEGKTPIKPEIIEHLQSLLSDPTREKLKRKNDPTNAVLRAGLKQELANLQKQTQPLYPTVQELVSQTSNITDVVLKKATQKTVSSLISLGGSGLVGADVVADISNSVMNALSARRLLHPKQALKAMQVYQGYKGVEGVKKATMPGQRRQEYAEQKILGRQAANIGVSVASALVPSAIALPVTAPLALYAAATRPEKFIENVASELPMSIAISGSYAGYRGGVHLHENAQIEKIKRLLRNTDSNASVLKDIDFTSKAGKQALIEHITEEVERERGDKHALTTTPVEATPPSGAGNIALSLPHENPPSPTNHTNLVNDAQPDMQNDAQPDMQEERHATSDKKNGRVERSLGDSRLYVEDRPAITIPESDRIAMTTYATQKYDRLKGGLDAEQPLSAHNESRLQDIYDIAYPHSLDIIQQMRQTLGEILKSHGENRLKPDSVVSFGVYHTNADGILVLKEEKQGTLLDLARGTYHSPNEEIRVRNLPANIQQLFHVTPYIGRQTFPITSQLEDSLKDKLADFDRTEPTVFREKIWQGRVNNTLCNLYEKEKIPELKEVMEGKRQPSLVRFENPGLFGSDPIDIGGVFAIKKNNGDMILVSVLQQKTVTISLNTRYNANQASKLREFLLPHFSLNEHQRLAGTTHRDAFSPYIVLNRAHHQFHDPQNPEKPTYRSPLFFPTANSTTALGKALAGLETQDMKANLDFLLTTEGEAWVKELIHQGKKVVNGMMLATAFAPSSWGFGLFNLGLSVTSYGLSALEISQEDDASKKEQLKSALLMDIVFSTPADIGDVSTVLNKFKKLRELPRPTPPQPPSRDGNRLTSVQPGTPAHRADGNPGQPPVSNDRQLNLQGFDQASKPPSPTITQFEQYAKPDNIIYRRPENKIGEGKLGSVYLIDDHQVIKEYRPKKIPRTPNLDYNGTYQKAKNNADAFNRLYGDNSATVYRYLENGQQKISARMKQLDGESLYSLSLPKNKYSANQVSQLFDDFKTESIDKLIDDTVNELVANKIIYNDFAQGNFIYSIDQKKLQVIDFDEAVIKSGNDIVTEAEKQQMRTSLKELLTNFKADVETNRLKMLQDDRELIAARSQFNHEIDGYKISHDSDKYQHLTTKQKEAYDNFNNGVNRIDQHDRKSLKEIKREVGMLLGPELEKKIKKLSEKELIALFNDPQKYKTTLTWEQKGILSHYIQKLGAKNRVEEVTQRLHDSAYQNIKGKGAKYSLHPQQLVITAAEVEDKGRCLPMVLINEAGYASGQMKQLGNNYQRIIDRIDVSQSKAYMQGIDKLHVQRIDPHIVSILDDANNAETKMPWKNITSMVDEVERCNASKSFLVTSDKHAMSIGVKIDGSKKTYHFQEPNIGWIEFKDAQSMKTYMEQTIGNKAQAENFGAHFNNTDNAEESFYRFAPIDTGKLKDVKVDGMGEWTVGDFSSSKTVAPINTIRIEDNIHQALPVGTAADNLQSLMLTPNQSLLSIKRPDFLKADYTQPTQNLKMRDFVNKLVRLNVKVFIDTDTSAQLSMAQARKLKEALQEKGISYISTQTTLLDCFMDGEYHYSSENVAENRNTLSQFNALIRKIEQESTAHPQANIMVCDNAGDGISGLLKSAIELKKQLEDQPNNFNHEIMDKKPTAKITTVISDNFSAASTQDNATYLIVQQAINTVRDDHPGAIERPSDVRLLNAYAEQLLASKNSELINNKIKDNTNNNDEIAEKINSLPAKGMGSLVEMKDRLTMSLAQYAVKWGGGGQYFTPVPEDIKNYINNGG